MELLEAVGTVKRQNRAGEGFFARSLAQGKRAGAASPRQGDIERRIRAPAPPNDPVLAKPAHGARMTERLG
jgi:hypothetical protein